MSILHKYHEAVEYVDSFSNTSPRNNFGKSKKDPGFFILRTQYFLDLINNPEKDFSYIHVTGTAGKGTVSTMIQEVLIASGEKVGLFTSPYVTTALEKIRVGELYISPTDFVDLVEYLRPFISKAQNGPYGGPSSFELYLVIALLYFKKENCKWIVLEVGLGGRYDATNVIAEPTVTVITNIDYDHTEILGKTLQKIAYDKMGIIKKGSVFFTSEQRPILLKLFKKTCTDVGAEFHSIDRQTSYSDYNRELVKAISRHLGISDKYIEQGVAGTQMPCRFEIIDHKPLVILDGAHNRAKINSTISNLEKLKNLNESGKPGRSKLYLILAIGDMSKDRLGILKPLLSLPFDTHIVITHVQTRDRRSVSPALLLPIAKKYKKTGDVLEAIDDPEMALGKVLKVAKNIDVVLVTGSFFLAGEIRKHWISEEWVVGNGRSFKKA